MPETTERWRLFTYVGTKLVILSKSFKSKEEAEKARLKYPEKERRQIAVGIIRPE